MRKALGSLTNPTLWSEVASRYALVARKRDAALCARCRTLQGVDFFRKDGNRGAHADYCEYLYAPSFIARYISKLTPLCEVCAAGTWAQGPSTERALSVVDLKHIMHYWKRKALKAGGHQRVSYWRAVYYWQTRVRQAQDAAERELADKLDQRGTPDLQPWYGVED